MKDVGIELGFEVEMKVRLEQLRGKLSKLAVRGWLCKLADDRFQIMP